MKRLKVLFFLGISLTGLLLTGCGHSKGSTKENGLKIVTSFYPVYAMTKVVSGDLNTVSLIQSSVGIHDYEPSSTDVAKIHDADVFIYHAHTLESWANALKTNLEDSNVQVIEASSQMTLDRVKGLETVEVKKGMDEASLYDPHTWNDPIKAAEEAQYIAEKLGELDPSHADVYQKNAEQFEAEAKALVDKYAESFAQAKSKYFVTSHTAFSYLAKRFNLEQLGIAGISTEQEPTTRQLTEIESFVKEYGIKTIFVEQGVSTKIAETVAKATGAQIATLSPLEIAPDNDQSYLQNLEDNLNILLNALNEKPIQEAAEKSASQKDASKTMAEIDKEEGISAEQVVVTIMEDGYVTSHGDHFHYYNGKVPYDALISEELLAPKDYQLDRNQIVSEIAGGYVLKMDQDYMIYLEDATNTSHIRTKAQIEAQAKTGND